MCHKYSPATRESSTEPSLAMPFNVSVRGGGGFCVPTLMSNKKAWRSVMRSGNEDRSSDVVIPDIYSGNDEFLGNAAILGTSSLYKVCHHSRRTEKRQELTAQGHHHFLVHPWVLRRHSQSPQQPRLQPPCCRWTARARCGET